jgi:outer membrane lipoprotein LolB
MRCYIFVIFGLLLLTGCTTTPKPALQSPLPTLTAPAPTKAKTTAPLQSWQAKGRLAAAQGEKGGNAAFTWQQRGNSYLVRLFGPFGSGGVVIKNYPSYVELKEANGKITRAQTPEALMQKIAGWQVPLNGLQYWLQATPIPRENSIKELDNNGRLTFLEQQGWKIFYEHYHDQHPQLPSKLRLENKNIRLKMVITSWTTQ